MDKMDKTFLTILGGVIIIFLIIIAFAAGIKEGQYYIVDNIKLISINENYENEVILSINEDLYVSDNWGKFNKYYTLKKGE